VIEVDGCTRIMGVIGDPVAQIRTPQAINPIFAARGANILCVPMHVRADGLAATVEGLRRLESVIGFGVTLPHKLAVMALCDSVDQAAARVGAVNLVRREADGSFRGYQFDGPGFLRGLMAHGHDPAGRACLVLGAGGAAMAIVHALLGADAMCVSVANRTAAKAEALAAACGDARVSAGPPHPPSGALVINTTALGMAADDPLPLDTDLIDGSMTVAEVVARPAITRLLGEAASRGAQTHSGMHMITHQVDLIADHMLNLYGPSSA
jgi:shikimate dehydrogenase